MKEQSRIFGAKVKLFISVAIFSFILEGCLMLAPSPKKQYTKATKNIPFDAIIVPGLPFEDGKWGDLMKSRMYWASYLYKKGFAKNVIFSGSAVYSPYVEAEIMAMYGEKLGIPPENIYMETRAEHSTENLYYSYQLARKHGFKKIALATDPYQGAFLYGFAKKKDIPVAYIPYVADTLLKMSRPDINIDYKKAYVEDFVSIKDRESFFERLRGTRGKKIVYEKKEDLREKEQVLLTDD